MLGDRQFVVRIPLYTLYKSAVLSLEDGWWSCCSLSYPTDVRDRLQSAEGRKGQNGITHQKTLRAGLLFRLSWLKIGKGS